MLKSRNLLLEYINLYSSNYYEKNDKVILKYFQQIPKKVKMKKIYCVVCGKYKKIKSPKIPYIFKGTLAFSIISSKYDSKDERIFKEEK